MNKRININLLPWLFMILFGYFCSDKWFYMAMGFAIRDTLQCFSQPTYRNVR